MRALIVLLATCWCRGYPVLQEPVYVLLSQPVASPGQDLISAIPKHAFQDASSHSSALSIASLEQEVRDGQFSSPPAAAQDPLLEGEVLVLDSPLVVDTVVDALTVDDLVASGALPVFDSLTVVEEETPVVNEALPLLETLTVLRESPLVNDGLLVAVTLTFLDDGTQALKGASLVDSSFITRHETPALKAASPLANAIADETFGGDVSLKKVSAQADALALGKSGTSVTEDTSAEVDSALLAMAADPPVAGGPVPVVKTNSPVVDPVPVVKATAPVVDPVPVVKATAPVVDPVLVNDPVSVVDPVLVAKAAVHAVHPIPVVKAVVPVAPVPVAKAAAPVVAAVSPVVAVAAPEPLLAPEPPMPSAATPFIGGQFHAQDEAGQYSFGHWGGSSTRVEIQDSLGRTSGSFAYVDAEGDVQVRKYASAPGFGFHVAASDLPLDSPTATRTLAASEDLVGRPVVSKV